MYPSHYRSPELDVTVHESEADEVGARVRCLAAEQQEAVVCVCSELESYVQFLVRAAQYGEGHIAEAHELRVLDDYV